MLLQKIACDILGNFECIGYGGGHQGRSKSCVSCKIHVVEICEGLDHTAFWPGEPFCNEHELSGNLATCVIRSCVLHAHSCDASVAAIRKAHGVGRPEARIFAHDALRFELPVSLRIYGARIGPHAGFACLGRAGCSHDLANGARALAQRRRDAVDAGVATPYDGHVFVFGCDGWLSIVEQSSCGFREVLDCIVDPAQVCSWYIDASRRSRSTCQDGPDRRKAAATLPAAEPKCRWLQVRIRSRCFSSR